MSAPAPARNHRAKFVDALEDVRTLLTFTRDECAEYGYRAAMDPLRSAVRGVENAIEALR